jgi:hydroxymethylglutaryl-CoA lyase
VTLATSFGCPFEGPVEPRQVLEVVRQVCDLDVTRVTLADTIGTAIPTEVRALAFAARAEGPIEELGLHLHDTRGLAVANALAGMEAGVDRLDGTVGGLGGCPFAPGASGNLPLEDLVHVLEAMGQPTGIDLGRLLEASAFACDLVDRAPTSHVAVAGPRFARREPATTRPRPGVVAS